MKSFLTATTFSFLTVTSLAVMSTFSASAFSSFLPKSVNTPSQEVSNQQSASYTSLCNFSLVDNHHGSPSLDLFNPNFVGCF